MSKIKTACIIHYWGEAFSPIGECAVRSFKKFHPNVDVVHINDKNHHQFKYLQKTKESVKGAERLVVAKELMKEQGYEKVIILGADTITCARLDEFLDDDTGFDILATWDYDYPLVTSRIITNAIQIHLNADVVCFNNVKAIEKILEVLPHHSELHYGEQGALNEVFYAENGISGGWVEGIPPHLSFYTANTAATKGPCYNVRSKSTLFYDERDEYGNRHWSYRKALCESPNKDLWKPFVNKFISEDGKLFTGDGRQIKVWHYCDGFGSPGTDMDSILDKWKNELFNSDTKKFFRDHCDCGDFFEEES